MQLEFVYITCTFFERFRCLKRQQSDYLNQLRWTNGKFETNAPTKNKTSSNEIREKRVSSREESLMNQDNVIGNNNLLMEEKVSIATNHSDRPTSLKENGSEKISNTLKKSRTSSLRKTGANNLLTKFFFSDQHNDFFKEPKRSDDFYEDRVNLNTGD